MKGNAEFLILFIPFLLIGIITIYLGWFYPLGEILGEIILVWIARIILSMIAIFCITVDVFALLVQYINWRYYKE